MNYAGPFGTDYLNDAPVSLTDQHIKTDSADTSPPGPIPHETIIVPDAQLLYSGDFNRLGNDLMLSNDGHEFLVMDYFRGEKRATLASPDGANLTGKVVEALTGHVQYAQAGDVQSTPKDIGQVSKVVGTATVIRNGVLIELHTGDRVYKGDVAQAGANSSCTIVFIDGSVFGLSANARMVLNDMVYDQAGTSNSALISLVRGTISFVAGETAKHGDMKVETPVATMGIRGTAVLVEIGFEIPSDGKGPPVNFQVLAEPDGTTGSYIVYSKSDPSVILGTIDKAGQVYSVSGNGTFSNLPSSEMSQVAAAIIQQVFTQRFQGYVPDKPVAPPNGSGGGAGSTPATPPDSSIPKNPAPPDTGPVTIPITIKVPASEGGTKTVTIPVGVGIADVAPTLTKASLSVLEGGTTLLKASDISVVDPDSASFTFTTTTTHGSFQINTGGNVWVVTTTFTSADLAAGHIRFVSDDSGIPPTVSLVANDGRLNSAPFSVAVDFNKSSLSSTEGVSINLSKDGATEGFTFPGAGNVTTPGTPEDRIVLGYQTTDSVTHAPVTHVLNSAPMLGVDDFHPIETTISEDGRSIATALDAGNKITLTQTISLGANASYFTTTIDVSNGNTTGSIDGVRFLRNFDPDQDVQKYGDYSTFNDVVQNPTKDEPFAIISAKGVESGVTISMIGFGLAWHASVYGFTNTDPYADAAYNNPVDPNGARADLSLTLTYDFASVAAGDHQQISYITTTNVASAGDDALFTTTASGSIDGKDGNDLIIDLGGSHALTGGAGSDIFVFGAAAGQATITDFAPGTDKIQLVGFDNTFNSDSTASFDGWLSAHATQSGSDVLIDLDLAHPGADTVLLQNTSLANLQDHPENFSVEFVNHAPAVTNDTDSVVDGKTFVTGNVLTNDHDPDFETLSVSSVTDSIESPTTFTVEGQYGELVIDKATGAYTYTIGVHEDQASSYAALGEGVTAQDTFHYKASDGTLDSSSAELAITVTGHIPPPPDQAPEAHDDVLAPSPQGEGWVVDADNGHYYRVVGENVSWQDAKSTAEGDGDYLATITSEAEQNFVASLISNGSAWLGGESTDNAEGNGHFFWVTGPEAGTAFDYTHWAAGEPNGDFGQATNVEILGVTGNNEWNDAPGSAEGRGYVEETGGRPADALNQHDVLTVSATTLLANDTDADSGDHLAIVPDNLISAHG
ncbi:MAG TPA: cadherin-like domain-containing protein, partial [Afipia sp.]